MEVLRTRLCEWKPVGIDALAFAPPRAPEPRLALSRSNGSVELWDTTTWHLHSAVPGCAQFSVRGFCWIPGALPTDRCRLISAGLHRELTEWDLESLRPQVSVPSGGGAVWSLCTVGNDCVCTACDDGSLRLFSIADDRLDYKQQIVVGKAKLLSLCSTGKDTIFAGGSDSRITKWSRSTKTCEASLKVEEVSADKQTLVWALVSVGEDTVASGDSLGLVHIFDAVAGICLQRFQQHQADVLCLSACPDTGVLLSGGADAKVSTFGFNPGSEERWVYRNASLCDTHDIRAVAVDRGRDGFVSGGVSGRLCLHGLRLAASRKASSQGVRWGRPLNCSSFSPVFQTACVAQSSRLMLCQKELQLEVWYLGKPAADKREETATTNDADAGVLMVAPESLAPDSQLLMSLSLRGPQAAAQGNISASAISADGSLIAASDLHGTRLLHVDLAEVQVRREKRLPKEVSAAAARALLFCGPEASPLLALAVWSGHEVLLLDTARLEVAARLAEHEAPVSHLAATGEWLASADVSGAVRVFSLDSLLLHGRVPAGSADGRPTALAFDASGRNLLVALSTHHIIAFDVEEQAFAAGFSTAPQVPPRILPPHLRICGIISSSSVPHKLMLWGHNFMVSLEVKPWRDAAGAGAAAGGPPEGKAEGKQAMRRTVDGPCIWHRLWQTPNLLGAVALNEALWGSSLLRGKPMLCAEEEGQPPGKRRRREADVSAMMITMEVSTEAAEAALPLAFERKRYHGQSTRSGGQRKAGAEAAASQ